VLVVFSGWLPNDRVAGETETVAATPVPLRATVCGLPVALSAIDRLAVLAPAVVGRKVTLMVQLFPAARLLPQLFVWAKFEALIPVREILLMATGPAAVFVKVTV